VIFESFSTTHAPALQKMLAKGRTRARTIQDRKSIRKCGWICGRALIDLIDYHDEALATWSNTGRSPRELECRSLKEKTNGEREGVSYLLRSVGFRCPARMKSISIRIRWKKGQPALFGVELAL